MPRTGRLGQPADYPANYPEWELLIQAQWGHDPNARRLPADYPLDVSDSDMWPVMFNAVGGSSIYYGAEWPRLLPSDFRVRTLDGVADDWPITYADLAPYNDRIDAFIGVSGLGGDPAYPDGLDYPLPPHPLGKAGRKAAEGMNALGWHWWPGTNAIPSQKFKELSSAHGGEHANGAARKARRPRQISRSGHTRYGPVRP
jgi:choline dehydrogenase-like flavoprotein